MMRRRAAFSTPVGQAASGDTMAYYSAGVHLLAEERVIIL